MSETFLFASWLLLITLMLAYTFHKVRRVDLKMYAALEQIQRTSEQNSQHTYQQIQAFIVLDRQLNLPYSLPVLRGWAASPDFLLLLAEHIIRQKPEIIVECSSGASTVVLAQTAKQNGTGHVYSLEHDQHYAQQTRHELQKQGLENWATVIDAPLSEQQFAEQAYSWYSVPTDIAAKQIDMLVIDGPPAHLNLLARYPAGRVLFPQLNKNAVVFLDDADRQDEQQIIKHWLAEFPQLQVSKYNCEKGAVSLEGW